MLSGSITDWSDPKRNQRTLHIYNSDHYSLDYGSTIMSVRKHNGIDSIHFACGKWKKKRRAYIEAGKWYMATFIKKNERVRYYINGFLGDEVQDVGNNTSLNGEISAAVLGVGRLFSMNRYFNGKIQNSLN